MHWLVGDVQGCARELDDLLGWVRFDPDRDSLCLLGDLINRGPDSLATLRLWRDVGGRGLLGNHDIYALRAHSGGCKRRDDTLQALFDAEDAEDLLGALRRLPALDRVEPESGSEPIWIVHAGVHPRWSDLESMAAELGAGEHDNRWLERDEVNFATRVRCCSAKGETCRHSGPPEQCPPPCLPWDEHYRGELRVAHGHWARRGAYRGKRTVGLDSGCVYGGHLTAWCPEEDRVVQLPSRERGGKVREHPLQGLPLWSPQR